MAICLSFEVPARFVVTELDAFGAAELVGQFDVTPHLSLQTLESPCGKGFETSERAF